MGPVHIDPVYSVVEERVVEKQTSAELALDYFLKGDRLMELKEYEAAIESYLAGLAIIPDDPTTLRLIGVALMKLERYEEAIEYFDQSLAIIWNPEVNSLKEDTITAILKEHN